MNPQATLQKPIEMWASHARERRRSLLLTKLRARLSMAGLRDRAILDLKKKLSPYGDSRILDAGCGGGRPLLRELGAVFGVEPDPRLAVQSREIYHSVKEATMENCPYPDDWFHALVCMDVLGHVENKEKFLSESMRVLRLGGTALFFAEPLSEDNWIWNTSLRCDPKTHERNWIERPDHRHLKTWRQYEYLFSSVGFGDIQITGAQGFIPECGLLSVLLDGQEKHLGKIARALVSADRLCSKTNLTREIGSLALTPLSFVNRYASVGAGLGLFIHATKPG